MAGRPRTRARSRLLEAIQARLNPRTIRALARRASLSHARLNPRGGTSLTFANFILYVPDGGRKTWVAKESERAAGNFYDPNVLLQDTYVQLIEEGGLGSRPLAEWKSITGVVLKDLISEGSKAKSRDPISRQAGRPRRGEKNYQRGPTGATGSDFAIHKQHSREGLYAPGGDELVHGREASSSLHAWVRSHFTNRDIPVLERAVTYIVLLPELLLLEEAQEGNWSDLEERIRFLQASAAEGRDEGLPETLWEADEDEAARLKGKAEKAEKFYLLLRKLRASSGQLMRNYAVDPETGGYKLGEIASATGFTNAALRSLRQDARMSLRSLPGDVQVTIDPGLLGW